jgi:hypothetical protein
MIRGCDARRRLHFGSIGSVTLVEGRRTVVRAAALNHPWAVPPRTEPLSAETSHVRQLKIAKTLVIRTR